MEKNDTYIYITEIEWMKCLREIEELEKKYLALRESLLQLRSLLIIGGDYE